MSRILLVDMNNLVHRNSRVSKLTDSNGRFTGGIYGTLNSMHRLLYMYSEYAPVLIWDSKSQSRKNEYAGYKSNRTPDEFGLEIYRQIRLSKKLFKLLGFCNIKIYGVEADDIIAFLASRNESIIVSTDKDFFQLLRYPHITLDRGNIQEVLDSVNFREKKGLSPDQYRIYHAVNGDDGDGISGIPGVGHKSAYEAALMLDTEIDTSPDWQEIANKFYSSGNGRVRNVAVNMQTVIRNYNLIELISGHRITNTARKLIRTIIEYGPCGINLAEVTEMLYDMEFDTLELGRPCFNPFYHQQHTYKVEV